MNKYILIDTETCSFNPKGHKGICDIGAIVFDDDFNILDQFESLIDPEMPISPSASGVHGITNEMVAHEPTIHEWLEVIGDRANYFKEPFIYTGYNCQFDQRFTDPSLGKNYAGTLDVMGWARRFIKVDSKGEPIENWKLQTLLYALELPEVGSHRALADCHTTLGVLKHIVALTGMTLKELTAGSEDALTPDTMPFGKHRGTKIEDVDTGYLHWLLTKCESLTDDRLRKKVEQVYNARLNPVPEKIDEDVPC